ncbi:hypothetical protein [Endozoicomonas sp. ALC066]|uniref:hypothetical protein n=1 Tax=Endozoicomonas sp. ALC066 TaxID=3403078 RepID=UPI003BB4FA3E
MDEDKGYVMWGKGIVGWKPPSHATEKEQEFITYCVINYGFLLNTLTHRCKKQDWLTFIGLIAASYDNGDAERLEDVILRVPVAC